MPIWFFRFAFLKLGDCSIFEIMKFKNKTVWVTGASSGIGRAMAVALSKEGASLILSSRNLEKLHETRTQ